MSKLRYKIISYESSFFAHFPPSSSEIEKKKVTTSLCLPSVSCLFQLFTETNALSHSYVQTLILDYDVNIKKGRSLT